MPEPENPDEPMTAPPPPAPQPPSSMAPIDPTKNVLDLVHAESKYQNDMRMMESRYQTAMRKAETRRQNDLARQKESFDRSEADILRIQVANNATLLSTQLGQSNAAMAERVSELERFRYETSGKGSGISSVIGYILTGLSVGLTAILVFVKFGG